MFLAQPRNIPLAARARKIVIDEHGTPGRKQAIRQIRTDEPRAPGDQRMSAPRTAGPAARGRSRTFANRVEPALGPQPEQQLRAAVSALQTVVVLAFVGMERISAAAHRNAVVRRLPVDSLDGRFQGVHEGAHLRPFLSAPRRKARLRDPKLAGLAEPLELGARIAHLALPSAPRELGAAGKSV